MTKNIVRVNKTKNYTIMSNTHLRDESLSWKAKGIHSYVLSLPDDWKIILSHLETISTDGEKSLRSGLKELYDLKYWQKYPVYVDGKVVQWVTEIYEEPFPENEKIKSITIRNNKKTINYENDKTQIEIIDADLLCHFGEVGEGKEDTGIDLLPQKVEVGNVEVEKVEVGKDGLLSTNLTNDLSFSNNSFYQSPEQNKGNDKKESEGEKESNKSTVNEFNNILNKCNYKDFQESNAIQQALRLLYYRDKPLRNSDMSIPPSQVREDLKLLEWGHIDYALRDYEIQSREIEIKYPIGYLATCIYNSIWQGDFKRDTELRFKDLI